MKEKLKSDQLHFYLLSSLTIIFSAGAASAIYLGYFLGSSALIFGSIGSYRLAKNKKRSTNRSVLVKTLKSLLDSFRELIILAPIALLSMIPKALSIGFLSVYIFQELFIKIQENTFNQDFYPLIDHSWRLILIGGIVASSWYNSFVFYWAAWFLLGLYTVEFLHTLTQSIRN